MPNKIVQNFRNSDFYKNLPPTSGKRFKDRLTEHRSKIRGHETSPHVVDSRADKPDPMLNTTVALGPNASEKTKKLPDRVKVPPSRPEKFKFRRPKKHNNLVTPGNWETK